MYRREIEQVQFPTQLPGGKVGAAVEEYRMLRDQLRAERHRGQELQGARERAVEADRDAYAKALRAGKADPGTPETEKADGLVVDSRRRVDALETALAGAYSDLVAVVDSARSGWQRRQAERTAKARQELADSVDAVHVAHADLQDALATDAWLVAFPQRGVFSPVGFVARVPRLRALNGEPFPVDEVLSALTHVADGGLLPSLPAGAGLSSSVDQRAGGLVATPAGMFVMPGAAGEEDD